MDIVFENSKFEEECNNQRLLVKKHGADRAKRIRRRLVVCQAKNCEFERE